jgi:hypothetical protein
MEQCGFCRLSRLVAGMLVLGLLGPESLNDLSPSRAVAAARPVCDPPSITADPESLTVCEGLVAEFTVEATGTPPLHYVWRKDGDPIDGAPDAPTYVIDAVTPDDAGVYDAFVWNACGDATSNPATLTVDTIPAIAEQPAGGNACEGEPITFTVTAEGTGPLSYQWRKDGIPIDGATDSSYVLEAVTPDDAGDYDVVVTNECGQTTSETATLFVGPPEITEQPASQSACTGARVTLSVSALGGDTVLTEDTIGSPDNAGSGGRIRGNAYAVQTTNALTRIEHYLNITTPGFIVFFVYEASADTGPYTLIVEDTVAQAGPGLGFYASNPLYVTLQAGKYYIIGAAWPGDHGYYWGGDHPQEVSFGETLAGYSHSYQYPLPDDPDPSSGLVYYQRLTTTATSLTFQWRKDDEDLPGETDPAYVIQSVSPSDTGDYEVVVANDCGVTASDAATLYVDVAEPLIIEHPADQAACVNSTAVFAVVADGMANSYQWRKNAANIPGATSATYTIDPVSFAHAGNYDVIVTNACGSTTSNIAVLQVDDSAPNITQQPTDQYACVGGPATFTVVAEGSGLSYQWRKNNEDIPAATEAAYTIDPVSYADAGYYEVIVTNGCGSTPSNAATLTVLDVAPTITQQPADIEACVGGPATFTVVADGQGLSYQWRKDGQNIQGATGSVYTINPVSSDDGGSYDVVVTNPCDSVTSDPATLTVETEPTITVQPVSQVACEGGLATFSVTVEGDGISYQWRKDDEDIPGATDSSYTIDPVSPDDFGDYTVVVTNNCGPITSDTATLTVINGAPSITQQPESQTVCEGDEVAFTVTAAGGALGYQWRVGSQEIDGATDSVYTIASVTVDDVGSYDVVVTNACGAETSDAATLVVDEWPWFEQQPTDQSGCVGDAATFSVVAKGTEPLSYQWRKNGENIPSATGDAYTIDPLALEDAGYYDVVVTNTCGSVISDAAVLTVGTPAQIDVQPTDQTACEAESVQFAVEASQASGVVNTIGSAGSSDTGARVRGNYYSASSTTTLTRIEHYLNITVTGSLVFFVYEAPVDEEGQYTLIAEDRVDEAGPGLGFYASGPLNVTLQAGKYYIIGTGWPASHKYYWGGAHPQTTAFGQSLYGYAGSYQDPLPQTAPYNTSTVVYHQRLTTTDVTLSYQWRKNGEDILDAIDPVYTIDAVVPDDAGIYDVVVSTDCGSVTSDPATLTVHSPPAITQQPSDQTVCIDGPVTFEVAAVGTAPLSYQWRKGGENIDGATESAYTIATATADDAGQYDVVVSNTCGSKTSHPATLTVTDQGPSITEQPADQTVCEGDAAVFAVLAEGDGLSYQWRKDDEDIPGATDASYTIESVALGDAGDYDVVVTNPCGSETSQAATLTVAERPAGDLDLDGDVDQGDLGILLASWAIDDGGDLDGDGDTDQADLGILLANWGRSCE